MSIDNDFVLYLGQKISYSRGAVHKWTGVCRRSQHTERCKYYYVPNRRCRITSVWRSRQTLSQGVA